MFPGTWRRSMRMMMKRSILNAPFPILNVRDYFANRYLPFLFAISIVCSPLRDVSDCFVFPLEHNCWARLTDFPLILKNLAFSLSPVHHVSPCISPVHVHRRWFAVLRISFTNWWFTVHGWWNEMIKAKCRTPLEPTRQSGDNFFADDNTVYSTRWQMLELDDGKFWRNRTNLDGGLFWQVCALCEFWQTTPPTMRQIPPYYIQCILRNRQIAPFPGSRNDDHCSRKPRNFVAKNINPRNIPEKL